MAEPYVFIELDKHRKLRFRHNDLADLEQAAGLGLTDLVTKQSFHGVRMLLAYGLRWEDPKMTPAKAGLLIDGWMKDGGTFEELTEKLFDALRASGFLKSAAGSTEGNETPEAAAS